ncbi:MAG: TetR family transcriptional regulator C-terminal domain-containing protein [Tabrizicola sp.]|uniref:TetR/AcrR family transcriptional regulator n=1 Tax=Tabrizicola sp. TaxID=2005166 RepID=UPI002ABA73A6|nr:TetR family transcriptional regulator C-terminal domain-containing protein [Tabrizicola sp.]MDZ4088157.1 TetR family transcriptional regulator C-terminal domain-containing protein [Tabrizicola sp.]
MPARFTRLSSEDRRAQLMDVALAGLAKGGIQEFTVDRICAAAGVSRGLILHHFGSMAGLLAAVYARLYRETTPDLTALPPETRIDALIEGTFAPKAFNRDTLNAWVALWGQIANTPALRDEHRRQYQAYLAQVSEAIAALAEARGQAVDAPPLARSLICLIDGLCLQHCLDPDAMSPQAAKAACRAFLAPHLG